MNHDPKYLTHEEYKELQDLITIIRQKVKTETNELNKLYTFLHTQYVSLMKAEIEIVKIRVEINQLIDKIDTRAMDAYHDDLHFDYLTGNL